MYGRATTDGEVACSAGREYGRRRHLRESAPELAAPRGRAPLCWPRHRGALPLCWPRRRGACPWAGHTAQGAPCTCLCATGSGSSGIVFFSMAGRPWPCSNPPPKISEPEREDGGINDIFPTFSLREYEK